MLPAISPRLALASLLAGGLLTAIFAALLIRFRADLRTEIHQKIIERDAAVLYPVALQQLAETETGAPDSPGDLEQLTPVLRNAQQGGMLAVAVFDAKGALIRAAPTSLLFVDLPVEDYLELTRLKPISRYHPAFRLDLTFAGVAPKQREAPVLEVLLPLHRGRSPELAGAARYFIDARSLAEELAIIDRQIDRQTTATIIIAAALIALVVTAAYAGLHRAQRVIAERNERLTRTNFELTLAAKASALGQIASHLIHGLQGPVAGLRAAMAGRESAPDWRSAADYTERLQSLIQETVSLLGDTRTQTSYELTGRELATIIRERNAPDARSRGVELLVNEGFTSTLDSHRGGMLCLIANNLVQNALVASARGGRVKTMLVNHAGVVSLTVSDDGPGIPDQIRAHLFEPGRSGRSGGSGLGLAISQLLARQIAADLILEQTGPEGTVFRLTLKTS